MENGVQQIKSEIKNKELEEIKKSLIDWNTVVADNSQTKTQISPTLKLLKEGKSNGKYY